MEQSYLLTVIIPHYNMIDLIFRCLDSIPKRQEIEVIVVDDNSTEDISRIRDYLGSIPNGAFYCNDTGKRGAGAARNVGIEKANGRWLLFADADDYFTDHFWDGIQKYLNMDLDTVYFPPASEIHSDGTTAGRGGDKSLNLRTYREDPTHENEIMLKFGWSVPWSKMIRRDVFIRNDIRFDETICANDVMGSTKAAYYSNRIAISDTEIYCAGDAHLSNTQSSEYIAVRTDVFIRRYNYLKSVLPPKDVESLNFPRMAALQFLFFIEIGTKMSNTISVYRLYSKNVPLFHRALVKEIGGRIKGRLFGHKV